MPPRPTGLVNQPKANYVLCCLMMQQLQGSIISFLTNNILANVILPAVSTYRFSNLILRICLQTMTSPFNCILQDRSIIYHVQELWCVITYYAHYTCFSFQDKCVCVCMRSIFSFVFKQIYGMTEGSVMGPDSIRICVTSQAQFFSNLLVLGYGLGFGNQVHSHCGSYQWAGNVQGLLPSLGQAGQQTHNS